MTSTSFPILELTGEEIPSRLRAIPDPPGRLYIKGSVELLAAVHLAVVGSRRPSGYGLKAAYAFSLRLAEAGYAIVSGLARGIDAVAHAAALKAKGKTIAVLGHGLNRIYPADNFRLAEEILQSGGCLVSEYPPDMPALKQHFPERNRIISGLSLGTLVIEASERSGSLITARTTLDQGRELFVVPSHFDHESFRGSHRLLQEGAKLVTRISDVLDELPPMGLRELQRRDGDITCNVFTLSELMERSRVPLSELLLSLKNDIESGEIAEVYPQHFIRIVQKFRKTRKEELPN